MQTVRLAHDYPLTAAELFARIVRFDELTEAMREIATYQGMPEGEAQVGQKFTVNVKLRGWLPTPPWTIQVVRRDDAASVLASLENGGPVKRWAHTIEIKETAHGSTMHDTIDIDAGMLTGFYVAQARSMYEARHAARRKLLGIEGGQKL